jgi:hypothetical protein
LECGHAGAPVIWGGGYRTGEGTGRTGMRRCLDAPEHGV